MKDKNFLQNYLKEVSLKVIPNKETFEKILKIKNILLETKKKKKKSVNIWQRRKCRYFKSC